MRVYNMYMCRPFVCSAIVTLLLTRCDAAHNVARANTSSIAAAKRQHHGAATLKMMNASTVHRYNAVVRMANGSSTRRHKEKNHDARASLPLHTPISRVKEKSHAAPVPLALHAPSRETETNMGWGHLLLAVALISLIWMATSGLKRLAAAPRWTHAVFCSAGVFGSFILHDFLQESIVKSTHGALPLGMTVFEFLACAVCPALELLVAGRPLFATGGTAPPWAFPGLSAFLLASMVLGNIALKYVSYPVKVVLKSSKLLPAMVMGKFILGKKYLVFQYLSAMLLCVGVIGCSYADRWVDKEGKAFSGFGLSLLLCAVCCDAISPVVQEQLLGKHQVHPAELMLRTNLIAFGGVALALVASAEYERYPALVETADGAAPRLLLSLCAYGMTSFVGVTFLLALIEKHGSAIGVAVGTLRKVVTILISFLWWRKPFSLAFALSGLAVFASIAMNSQAKRLDVALCGGRAR